MKAASFKRRNLLLFVAGMCIFLATAVCGFGASQSAAPLATPSFDLSKPSGGGGAPQATQALSTSLPVAIAPSATPGEPVVVAPPPAITESRRVTLEYPPQMRAGDADVIRLTLEVDTLGGVTPTAEIQGHRVTGQTVQIPNLYDTHDVIAEAELDLAGVEVRPSEEVRQALLPGQSVTFYWSVQPTDVGIYRGTAWLFLRYVDKATRQESRTAISAQPVEINATNLFGLSGNAARTAGGVGSVVGAVLGIPFIDDVLKWLWGRLRRNQ